MKLPVNFFSRMNENISRSCFHIRAYTFLIDFSHLAPRRWSSLFGTPVAYFSGRGSVPSPHPPVTLFSVTFLFPWFTEIYRWWNSRSAYFDFWRFLVSCINVLYWSCFLPAVKSLLSGKNREVTYNRRNFFANLGLTCRNAYLILAPSFNTAWPHAQQTPQRYPPLDTAILHQMFNNCSLLLFFFSLSQFVHRNVNTIITHWSPINLWLLVQVAQHAW